MTMQSGQLCNSWCVCEVFHVGTTEVCKITLLERKVMLLECGVITNNR
jgi:hypothetical protein